MSMSLVCAKNLVSCSDGKDADAFFGNWLDEQGLAALHRTDLQ